MHVRVRGDEVLDVELRIFEPPRLFEALLRGRALGEAPDITARICGICPVAYQTSACQAMEDALGIEVEGQLRNLRRLIYCGEWIESHCPAPLHAARARLPRLRERLRDGPRPPRGRRARAARQEDRQPADRGWSAGAPCTRSTSGSAASTGRRSGASWRPLRPELERCREEALETVRWTAGLDFPELERDYELVALRSRSRASTRSTAAGSSPRRESTSRPPSSTRPSRSSTSPTRRRCTRGCAAAAPT